MSEVLVYAGKVIGYNKINIYKFSDLPNHKKCLYLFTKDDILKICKYDFLNKPNQLNQEYAKYIRFGIILPFYINKICGYLSISPDKILDNLHDKKNERYVLHIINIFSDTNKKIGDDCTEINELRNVIAEIKKMIS